MIKRFAALLLGFSVLFPFCKQKTHSVSTEAINDIHLKRGDIISCGTPDKEFGTAAFKTFCKEENRNDFNLAIELLHSFEYDDAEKAFAKVIDKDPGCAMAYWGVAMSNFHPLWTPPSGDELKKGGKAISLAKSLKSSPREADYIDAIASFYQDWEKIDHRTRCLNFEKGMEKVYAAYPEDKEAAIFYALSLNAAADPSDKSFTRQKKAGEILNALYVSQPNHPGIVHYLIHTYDYPELAMLGLDAARKYASVAPSSSHALHMPSHIFTRLGLWDECIQSNIASMSSAKCYAEAAGIKGQWDEELHALDYLVYAYLQKGENDSAKQLVDYLNSMSEVHPVNFKVAYAFAAIPSRYFLENKMWSEAADLQLSKINMNWKNFPWQEAIFHFTHALGTVHTGKPGATQEDIEILNRIHDTLVNQKDDYKANQVAIQIKAAEAWLKWTEGKSGEALSLMQLAATMEDKTEKHPVTPGEILPARELLGDMFMQMNKPREAFNAYEASLQKHPGRFNSLYGAGIAAEKLGDTKTAASYFQQLIQIADAKSGRMEIAEVMRFQKGIR